MARGVRQIEGEGASPMYAYARASKDAGVFFFVVLSTWGALADFAYHKVSALELGRWLNHGSSHKRRQKDFFLLDFEALRTFSKRDLILRISPRRWRTKIKDMTDHL